jgi:outer membrane lipoprotein SlyB
MKVIANNGWLAAIAVSGILLGGCASPQSGTNFSRNEALRAQRTYYGVIESVTEGRIDGTKTGIGTVAGGVLGGVAGHSVGGGSGKDIATVGGALAGAVVGSIAEEVTTRQQAYSLTVKLDDGRVLTIVQNASTPFNIGQRVKVIETDADRMRVQTQ